MDPENDRDRYVRQLDEALAVGLAGIADGRLIDADDVFDELDARYADKPDSKEATCGTPS